MKVWTSPSSKPEITDFVKIEHEAFGTLYITPKDEGQEQGFHIISERSMQIFPRMDNSIRLMSAPREKRKANP